jgi:H+-transporting ATPase
LLEIAIVLQLALSDYVECNHWGTSLVQYRHRVVSREPNTFDDRIARLALNASVLRDGAWTIFPAAELVSGDIVKLSLGLVVAADVRVSEGSILLDQSMLTSESLPVEAGPGTETLCRRVGPTGA